MKRLLITLLLGILAFLIAAQGVNTPASNQIFDGAEIFKRGKPQRCESVDFKTPKCVRPLIKQATDKYCKSPGDYKCRCKKRKVYKAWVDKAVHKCGAAPAYKAAKVQSEVCKCATR